MKTCFVIMGFGVKADPSSGKTINLDMTYKHIIKPSVEKAGFKCVRADEIKESAIIDRSMYVLLMRSDLVIADISTFNPNAIYELGVRHAVKPFSTIIMKEETGKIPFDINHNRIFEYSHLGPDIGADEVERCMRELTVLIKTVTTNPQTDSPLYSYLNVNNIPEISDEEYESVIKEIAETEKTIFAITELAQEKRRRCDFLEASKLWQKAVELVENEPYFIQQQALCTYKSKYPSEQTSLNDAFLIIEKLLINGTSSDPETLGICGAINKRLWFLTNDIEYLKRATEFYEKGFTIFGDYYTGENFAECLDLMSKTTKEDDDKIYFKIRAKKTRETILNLLDDIINLDVLNLDYKWQYATISICYLRLNNSNLSSKFETFFMQTNPEKWEIESFNETKQRS